MSNITVIRSISVPPSFDLKAILPDPEKLAFDAAGFNLQREFMTEAMVRNVPLDFDAKRAGKHLREALGVDYMEGLRFVIVPRPLGEIPLIPLIVAFNRPMPLLDMVENLTKMTERETRLCGGDPDICIRQLEHSNGGLFNKLLAAGKIIPPDGP
jgi:hypothetical protein